MTDLDTLATTDWTDAIEEDAAYLGRLLASDSALVREVTDAGGVLVRAWTQDGAAGREVLAEVQVHGETWWVEDTGGEPVWHETSPL
jgi:hypothetical protein